MKNNKTVMRPKKIRFTKSKIEKAIGKPIKTGLFLKVSALLIGVLLLILIFFVKQSSYFPIDLKTTLFLQHFKSQYLFDLMTFISFFGYGLLKYIVLLLFAGFLYFKKLVREAALLLFSTLGADITSNFLKTIISRERPDPKLIHQIGHFVSHDSYPSGHVVFYVGFFGFLLFLIFRFVKNRAIKALLVTLCLFFIVLVGPSRIYLGAHWITDVIGGYLLGALWVLVSIWIYKGRVLKNEK